MSPPAQQATSQSQSWWPCVLVLGVGLAAYHNSFDGLFVLDDLRNIVQNESIRTLAMPPSWWRPTTRPLTEWTFALNYATSGLDRYGWHLANLAIHLATAVCWFWLLRDGLERAGWLHWSGWSSAWTAAMCTSLWVVHPLTTEGVTYLVQRSESLAACGMLATLIAWNRFVFARRSRWGWLALSGIAAIAAAAAKPTAVVLPGLVLLYDRSICSSSWSDLRRRALPILLIGLPALWQLCDAFQLGLLSAPIVTGSGTSTQATAGLGAAGLSSGEYFRSQSGILLYYLWLIVSGTAQSLDYGWQVTERGAVIASTGILAGLLLLGSLWLWRKHAGYGALALAVFVLLAPTSSLVPLRDLAVEHRLYLPSACVLALLMLATLAVGGKVAAASASQRTKLWVSGGFVVILLLLMARTIVRNADYADEVRLWSRAIAVSPKHPRIHTYLGAAWQRRGDSRKALAALEESVALYETATGKPIAPPLEVASAHNLLGTLYQEAGEGKLALDQLQRAVSLVPESALFHANLGAALDRQGDTTAAAIEYRIALEIDPGLTLARVNLGRMLLRTDHIAEAVEVLNPLGEQPPTVLGHLALADALTRNGDFAAAESTYRQLVDRKLATAETYIAWGKLDRSRGNYAAAYRNFITAAKMAPNDPWPPALQAEMLARLGHRAEADRLAAQLLSRLPPDSVVAEQLRQLRASLHP